MAWTIKGEAGKTLDAAALSLDSLNLSACVLKFQSLAGDSLTWTAKTADATGAGTIVPDAGQVVELWQDSTRKFKGHVTGVRVETRKITIEVQGPWWWLERTNLTSDQTSAGGTTAERPLYVFASGDLKTHLENLIDRAIANGAPMARGTVATAYDIPQATLAEQPCSEALATLLAWMPDAVTWFDYSGATPVFNIGRRGAFAATTYTLGTDAVEMGELVPRLDLEVTRNELHYVTRNATTGKPEWALQASGTNTAGKRQIVAVSGPEVVDFLPRDDFESASAVTYTGSVSAYVWEHDPGLGQAIGWPTYGAGAIANSLDFYTVPYDRVQYSPVYFPSYLIQNADGSVNTAGGYILTTTNLPEWAITALNAVRVTLSGTWVVTWPASQGAFPNWYKQLQVGATTGAGYTGASGLNLVNYTHYLARPFKVECLLVAAARTAPGTVYKPWEFSYLTPPAGLAANLVAAQNWVPWEGPLTLVADDCSGDNLLAAKYHLAGGLSACATMGALARGVTHDLMLDRTTIDLGAPARLDFGTLVSRIRREPKDNIVYL